MRALMSLPLVAVLGACAQVPTRPADPATVAALERATSHPCVEAAARGLAAAQVPVGQVGQVFFTEQVSQMEDNDVIVGYLGWIRVAGQPGYLIVDTDQFCRVEQVYTRDGMRLAGIPAW